MEVVSDPAAFPRLRECSVVTIGAYDGVHLGHQAVVEHVHRLARSRGHRSVVVTFDRHPATVVRPQSAPKLLTDLDQKLELLAATGHLDHALVIRFDQQRARQSAEDFVTEVLVGAVRAAVVVVGRDFHFGRQRRGNVDLLRQVGGALGFEVLGVELVARADGSGPVSSTAVRRLLAAGDVTGAAALLGRLHEVRGVVAAGDGRGRGLGFPTANLQVPAEILLPADGIYAGWYQLPSGEIHPAALSLGQRPTFRRSGDQARPSVLEAYLLDFEGDLYGQPARVRFAARLRGEERFDSPDALVAQVARDVQETRATLCAPGLASEP